MAKTVDKMLLEMVVENKKAISRMNQVQKKGKQIQTESKGLVSKLRIGWLAAAGAIYGVVRALKSMVTAYGVQEKAEKTLAAAMKVAGTFTKEALQHNLDYASSLQKMTTFGDEAILGVQKLLTNFGVEGEMLDRLTKSTLDLAAAKGMDLTAAADLVSKSVGSSTNALSRYGIKVEGAVGSTERMQQAVDNIAKLFGGAAQAEAETFTGGITQMQNVVGDLGESIGELLVPAIKFVVKWLKAGALALNAWAESAKRVREINKEERSELEIINSVLAEYNLKGREQLGLIESLASSTRLYNDALKIQKEQGIDMSIEMGVYSEHIQRSKEALAEYNITGQQAIEIQNQITEALMGDIEAKALAEEQRIADEEAEIVRVEAEKERIVALEEAKKASAEAEKKRIAERKILIADLLKFQVDSEKNLTKLTNAELQARLKAHQDAEKLKLEISQTFVSGVLAGIESMKSSSRDVLVSMIKSFVNFIAGKLAAMAAMNLASVVTAPIGILQLAAAGVVKALGGSAAAKIASAEQGMDSAPGGSVLVGEAGPEIVNIPKGSQIIPNHKINMSRFNTIPAFQNGTTGAGDMITNSGGNVFVEKVELTPETPEDFREKLMEFGESVNVDFVNP